MAESMDEESNKVWTTANENPANLSRVSTASANGTEKPIKKSKGGSPYLVGIQSKFKRKHFHKIIYCLLFVIILLLLIGVIMLAVALANIYFNVCQTKDCLRSAANLLQSMDLEADPCDDFYQFTCGNWAEDHPRPDSSTSYDWFSDKQAKIIRSIREFLKANNTGSEPYAVRQSRNMYRACVDTEAMDDLGLGPVLDYLEELNLPKWPTLLNVTEANSTSYNFDWIRSIVLIKRTYEADVMIGFDIFPDPRNRSINRLVLGTPESGSTLPFSKDFDRHRTKTQRSLLMRMIEQEDSEDEDDESTVKAVSAYVSYVAEVMSAVVFFANPDLKLNNAVSSLQNVAQISVNMTRFIYKLNQAAENITNKINPLEDMMDMTVTQFQNATDQMIFPKTMPIWHQYLQQVFKNVPESIYNPSTDLILTSKADIMYLSSLVEYLNTIPLAHIELFIWWTVVEELVLHTTTEIRQLHNDYSKTVTNLEESRPRSLYCATGVNEMMGMAVSYAIANSGFFTDTKPKVAQMLNYIRGSFEDLVHQTRWMDAETRKETLKKSAAMHSLIGFPEFILENGGIDKYYDGIVLRNDTHLENMMTILKARILHKLKNFRMETELGWATYPTNVNAFHTFQANAITVPFAILQYPFYELGLEALNYGAIGTILGHELTHGFDDTGRMYDENGNIRQWWTNNTIKEYVNRTSCFINQYGKYYMPEIKEHINGELTLGENIADNGGLREAFMAYQLYKGDNKPEKLLPGFERYTHDQIFFISFGNLWCETQTVASARWALEDSHCPGRIRLKGVLTNSPEFASTFNCKRGSNMYPSDDRCRIW